jgi:hypothetical protein
MKGRLFVFARWAGAIPGPLSKEERSARQFALWAGFPGDPLLVELLPKMRAGDGTRTYDLHVGNVSLYQLSYTRVLVLTILPVLPPL